MLFCKCLYKECDFEFAVANDDFIDVRYCPKCGRIGPDMDVLEIKEIKTGKTRLNK
jgi:hypothetical protein